MAAEQALWAVGPRVASFPGIVQLVSATGNPIESRTVRDGVAINDGQHAWLRLVVLSP